MTCTNPNCPHNHPPPSPVEDPRCICRKPLLLALLPGQHIHCPVHPHSVIRGSDIVSRNGSYAMVKSNVLWMSSQRNVEWWRQR